MPITIGIPFYNAEAYLADAIRSVFAQTWQDWELILVDDGSKDRSLEIARAVRDPRVRVLSDGENRKLPYRLNQITAEARFDLIGRMDADDLISPVRFERQMAVLQARPDVDLVTTGVCSFSNDNVPVGQRCGSPDDAITGKKLLLGQCAVVHAAILGRKAWFERNPYNLSIARAQDYELWLRAFSKSDFSIHILGEPLYYYREEDNVTVSRLLAAYEGHRKMYRRYGKLWCTPKEALVMTATSHAKSLAVRGLSLAGKLDLLLNRRNSVLSEAQLDHFNAEIRQVMETRVPGLD